MLHYISAKCTAALAKISRFVRWLAFPFQVKVLRGRIDNRRQSQGVVVTCLVRNGIEYISNFFEHYNSLGVSGYIFLDNGSTDGTLEQILSREEDVVVLRSIAPYKKYKHLMKRYLTKIGGRGWVLCVDIDEMFDFPLRAGRSIDTLIGYLDRHGYNAVIAHMLDMFPGRDNELHKHNWIETHDRYTVDGITRHKYSDICKEGNLLDFDQIRFFCGGLRDLKFNIQPFLTKHPLVKPSLGVDFYHHHKIRGGVIADLTCVLLHYKFAGDMERRFATAVREENYDNNSQEYKVYLSGIRHGATLADPTASRLVHVDQLIDETFLCVSQRFTKELGR